MPIRVGLLTEGHDHLILRSYLARLLDVDEAEIEADFPDGTGHGWQFVDRTVDRALRRFYARCAQVAILAMDNDGNLDLRSSGGQEDPRRPRHWLHAETGSHPLCRWCLLHDGAEATRPALNWMPDKPGAAWPILIVVPVETIEAWLLITRAILQPGTGSLHAEREPRSNFKVRLYGRPAATRDDVEDIAVPMIRQLDADQLQSLREHSRSFANFADQVERHRDEILTSPFCG